VDTRDSSTCESLFFLPAYNSQSPSAIKANALRVWIIVEYGLSIETRNEPARDANDAYTKSADAAPAPAHQATGKPRRIPSSMIKIAIGPMGMAMPYPAIKPWTKSSRLKVDQKPRPPMN